MTARENGATPTLFRGDSWKWNLGLWAAAALWVLCLGNLGETLERRWFDQTLRWRGSLGWTPPADSRIVILGLDDVDLAALPSLEEEYRAAARLIRQGFELGAAAIVFDVIYARGTEAMAEPIREEMTKAAPVVMAEVMRQRPGSHTVPERLRSFPFRPVRATPAGIVNIAADADGVHRAYSLLHWTGSAFEPSLALAAWLSTQGLSWDADVRQPSPGVIRWPELSADGSRVEETGLVERSGRPRFLNFRGAWRDGAGFDHLTLRRLDALYEESAGDGAQPLAGKILFVANVATGIADVGPTAFGSNEPLVLLHATALNDLIQDSFLRRAPRWGDALAFLSVPLFGLAMPFCVRKRWLLVLWLLVLAAIFGGGLAMIFYAEVLPATIGTAALWTLAVVVEIARRHTQEAAERHRLRSTMGLYFSPRVLKDVLAQPGRLEPKRARITALLTDVRNSTPLAERLGPEDMLNLLNKVFEVQNRAVFAEEGSLETPVGDQFLAYWGAPDPQPDASDRALRAAFTLIEGMHALRESLEPEIRELFGFGVALHTDYALIGNIGSVQYFHYGPVGDVLNVAARVESLTKYYGVLFLITRKVLSQLSKKPEHRLLDRVIVKGKSTSVDLIEVRHKFSPQNFAELSEQYAAAFEYYQQGDFVEAERRFRELADVSKPSRVMAERCAQLRLNPPVQWQGIFTLETK
jgi:adenylate cyclase